MLNNHLPFNRLRASDYLRAYYLRAYKAPLHLSRNLYKSTHFMQNKPNLLDAQMNVNDDRKKDYENETLGESGKNKANSKPTKACPERSRMGQFAG